MPFGSIQLRPGVNTIATPTLNQASISTCNLVRFRGGLVEKFGGWMRYISGGSGMGSVTRCLHAWQDLASNVLVGAGSLQSLKAAINAVSVMDITPETFSSSIAPNISSTKGSDIFTIVDTNVGTLTQYDSVFFNTPVSIGGIVLGGHYQILPTPVATTYTIRAQAYATSTVANSGTVPSFTTTANSPIVTVTLASHGLVDGDYFVFPIPTSVGGLVIVGTYNNIIKVNDNSFTIFASAQALSAATVSMNSGNASFVYNISVAPLLAPSGMFGAIGPLGEFAIGEGYARTTTYSYQTGTAITATDWTLDNWGELLIACPRGGAIWYWSYTSGFQTAIPVGDGPAINNGLFVAMPAQILVCWGSTRTINRGQTDAGQDPLIVRWSDQLDFTEWRVTSRTQAGSFRIPTGSEIRGGIQAATQAYIFTDIDAWSMQYMGPPLVFSFNQIGSGCGLIGPHAVTNLFGKTYWMSDSNFFATGGTGVQSIPCPIWDTIFYDLDLSSAHKCVAAANSQFSEVIFFYPSISGMTGECDKYAKYNVVENVWDYGSMPRSAWTDKSVAGYPIGADPTTTLLQQHETGTSGDGTAMNSFFETGYIAYGDGENFAVIDYFEPDMRWNTTSASTSAQVTFTLTAVPSPNGPTMVSSPVTLTSTSYYTTPRVRGRQVKWRLESNDINSWWRIGNTRYRYTVDGRR